MVSALVTPFRSLSPGAFEVGDVATRQRGGAGKHQVLHQMRQPKLSGGFVFCPHAVGDVDRHRGRCGIFMYQQRQAVIQGKALEGDIGQRGGQVGRGRFVHAGSISKRMYRAMVSADRTNQAMLFHNPDDAFVD
ncbi:hypothetical protein LNO88_28875 [Klebsiella pneumoniae subsp. pneumoniae]|nr:hypothetical protein [Klebsiella pneumoniae subsp. pneumoniae]